MGLGREAGESKYFPPTYDPRAKAGTGKYLSKKGPQTVRIMLPFGLQCGQCAKWIGQNTKFLSEKQKVEGEDYLGIAIHRLIFRCANCSNAISIKTDPKNYDYSVEFGATRAYQHHKAEKDRMDAEDAAREEAKGDQMAEHNQKVLDTQKHASEMEQLEEQMYKVASRAHLTIEDLLEANTSKRTLTDAEAEAQDEAEAARVFAAKRDGNGKASAAVDQPAATTAKRKFSEVEGPGTDANGTAADDAADDDVLNPGLDFDVDVKAKPKKRAKKKKKAGADDDEAQGLGGLLGY